jgi:hypothetical protein
MSISLSLFRCVSETKVDVTLQRKRKRKNMAEKQLSKTVLLPPRSIGNYLPIKLLG